MWFFYLIFLCVSPLTLLGGLSDSFHDSKTKNKYSAFDLSIPKDQPQIILDLNHPCYEDGVLSTKEGGVLIAPNFRVQAQSFIYTHNLDIDPPVFTIECHGNLLIDYQEWVLVGDSLYYDFLTHTGFLIHGKTAQPPWYLGGNEILLFEDGHLIVIDGFLTTSEAKYPDIAIRSPKITLSKNHVMEAKNITFTIEEIPVFWFPQICFDLENCRNTPFAVKFGWGGFMGSYLGLLYHFLNWKDFQGTARIDEFFGHGLGGGIETRYHQKFKSTQFYTRSYYVHDIAINDPNDRDRYQFQGTYHDSFYGMSIDGMYDYVSDPNMASDFQIQDFELPTAGRTQLELKKQTDLWIAALFGNVRINSFQSVNQELPTFSFYLHPFQIPHTGIIIENIFKASYLNYAFSEDVHGKNFQSGRISFSPHAYRPFLFGPITATPEVAFIGIGYTNTPSGNSAGQGIGKFGIHFNSCLSKSNQRLKHLVKPYIDYTYLTQPSVSNNDHFIFTINDGYHQLNLLKMGIENKIFVKGSSGIFQPLTVDAWANIFIDQKTHRKAIPKGYLNIEWQPSQSLLFTLDGGWNFLNDQVDFFSGRIDATVSHHLAFGLDYCYHSKFDWRKADFYNFILESAHNEKELLESPLSFRRQTLLFRMFIRPTPNWTAQLDSRYGWNRGHQTFIGKNGELFREKQKNFLEYQVEFRRTLFNHWDLRLIYEKRVADHRYLISLKINPERPPKLSYR
ncbi:MAG: hypothetical protein R3E91_01190 [Chlamydiales bacterium]